MPIRAALVSCIVLVAACAKKADGQAERDHPPTAECTQLHDHILAIGNAHPEQFKDTPSTPEAWATTWEWKCRAERAKLDLACAMAAASAEDLARCPAK